VEGKRVVLGEGDAVFVPAGAEHSFSGYENLSVLVIFEPSSVVTAAHNPCARGCRAAASTRRFPRKEAVMSTINEAAEEFLSHERVAVTGVSRNARDHGSNVVYKRLRDRGYQVFAVNPNADEVEGERCFHDLRSIPGGVEAVVIGTRPEHAEETMRECDELGIKRVWMHRGPGAGSVSEAATDYGRQHGITVIDGGCPCMFGPTADLGHRAMRMVFKLSSNVPKEV